MEEMETAIAAEKGLGVIRELSVTAFDGDDWPAKGETEKHAVETIGDNNVGSEDRSRGRSDESIAVAPLSSDSGPAGCWKRPSELRLRAINDIEGTIGDVRGTANDFHSDAEVGPVTSKWLER